MDNTQGHKFKLELLLQKLSNLLEIYINRNTLSEVVDNNDMSELKKKIDEFTNKYTN